MRLPQPAQPPRNLDKTQPPQPQKPPILPLNTEVTIPLKCFNDNIYFLENIKQGFQRIVS